MGLKIENDEAQRLARELADMTGESMVTAVTIAIRERRDRLRASQGGDLAERLLAIGRNAAAHRPASAHPRDHADLLYDERGIPR